MLARFTWITPVTFASLAVAVSACSVGALGGGPAVPAAVPQALLLRDAGPFAERPPVKNGEVLSYTNYYTGTLTTWSGPTASPTSSPYVGTSNNTTTYGYDSIDHIYQSAYAEKGYTKTTYFGFASVNGGLEEITFNDKTAYIYPGIFGTDFFPAGELSAILPFVRGASWSDAAADVSTELDQDSSTWTTANLDGSYFAQEHPIIAAGIGTISLKADGSAVSRVQNEGQTQDRVAVAVPQREGKGYLIPGTTQQAVAFPATPPPPRPFLASDWYPDKAPRPLYADRTRVAGSTKTPASCKTQAKLATTETIEIYKRLDPIEAYDIESTEASYYGHGGYILCQIRNITETIYDIVSGKPKQRDAETDTNVLTSAKGAAGASAVPAALSAMPVHPLGVPSDHLPTGIMKIVHGSGWR